MEYKDFNEAMRCLVKDNGKDALLGDKAKAYVSDYKGQFDTEADIFLKMLKADCAKYINEACCPPAVDSLGVCPANSMTLLEIKRQLVERMDEKHGISPRHSMPLLDLLGLLLRGDTSKIGNGDRGLQSKHFDQTQRLQITNPLPTPNSPLPTSEAPAEAKRKAEDQYHQSCTSRYDDALTIHKTQKYKKAFPLFEAIANEGYAPAQEMLGIYYKDGMGVWKDKKKSDEWFRKAFEGYSKFAELGVAEAQCSLGSCYFYGNGISQDYAKSAEWYGKAAEQGFAKAQYDMGHCYHFGEGVKQDYAKAAEWYDKAAAQGYEANGVKWAHNALDKLKSEGKI